MAKTTLASQFLLPIKTMLLHIPSFVYSLIESLNMMAVTLCNCQVLKVLNILLYKSTYVLFINLL